MPSLFSFCVLVTYTNFYDRYFSRRTRRVWRIHVLSYFTCADRLLPQPTLDLFTVDQVAPTAWVLQTGFRPWWVRYYLWGHIWPWQSADRRGLYHRRDASIRSDSPPWKIVCPDPPNRMWPLGLSLQIVSIFTKISSAIKQIVRKQIKFMDSWDYVFGRLRWSLAFLSYVVGVAR